MASPFSFQSLHRAYLACRRGKRGKQSALAFEWDLEENLAALRDELASGRYRPSPSACFVDQRNKAREIFAADFRDRVVHHAIVGLLEPDWERVFIHDSYACRKGKGTHAAVRRLRRFTRSVTGNGAARAWYLHLDVRSYFMSIRRDILYAMVAERIRSRSVRRLAEIVIFHDCTEDPIFLDSPKRLRALPQGKSLFHVGKERGLPIGNHTSQFFANVYLNGLDQFVKHTLKCRRYLRYCDDFALLNRDRERLVGWAAAIEAYLRDELDLALNPRRRLRPVSDGIDFVSYVVRPGYVLVRRRVVRACKRKIERAKGDLVQSSGGTEIVLYDRGKADRLHAAVSSYLGHFRHANAFDLCERILGRPWLRDFFSITIEGRTVRLARLYLPPARPRGLPGQWHHFRHAFPGRIVFVQVGCYIETYNGQARQAAKQMGLRLRSGRSRFHVRCGFPISHAGKYLGRALCAGLPFMVLYQTGVVEQSGARRAPWFGVAGLGGMD